MMFNDSTVLVLGAGASNPYGFPLGADLKQRIVGLCSNADSAECKQFVEAELPKEQIQVFHTDLVRSIHGTIDAFLEDRPSHRDIGAFAIAHILMRLEDEQSIFPGRDWYPILFRDLKLREVDKPSEISGIVTFNYDRSLEHYLTETARRTFEGTRRDAALRKLHSIPIVHVHGMLGSYPEMPYKTTRSTGEIEKGAAGISMVHDAHLDSAEEFKSANKLIEEAREVIFLGFGYDTRNLKRLGILNRDSLPVVRGTALGLESAQAGEVKKLFNGRILLDNSGNTIENYLPHFRNLGHH